MFDIYVASLQLGRVKLPTLVKYINNIEFLILEVVILINITLPFNSFQAEIFKY